MITVGYQGIKGSNSEEAARLLAEKNKLKNAQLLPLVSSFNVLDSVQNGSIDYGVVAIRNNTGGTVSESVQSLQHLNVTLVDQITLPIHHFLYVKHAGIKREDITQITSHLQALIQCQSTLQTQFPNIPLVSDEDTATAARKLRLDLLDDTVGVLCRKNAGEFNELYLLASNLEDKPDNTTDFEMYKK